MKYLVSNHFLARMVERLTGIKDDSECKRYIARNREKLDKDIEKLLDNAKYVYSGNFGNPVKGGERNYYLSDDIAIVEDPVTSRKITMYRVVLPFSKRLSRTVVKELKEDILSGQDEIAVIEKEAIDIEVRNVEEIYKIDDELKLLEEEYLTKKKELEGNRKKYSSEILKKREEVDVRRSEVDKYAKMLFTKVSIGKVKG